MVIALLEHTTISHKTENVKELKVLEFDKLEERQIILQLALQEAFRNRDECQNDFYELDHKLSAMTADGCSFKERDKVVESLLYLEECTKSWQSIISQIREWEDELKI